MTSAFGPIGVIDVDRSVVFIGAVGIGAASWC